MKKRYIIPTIILVAFILVFIVIFVFTKEDDDPIKLSRVKVENEDILLISDDEKTKCTEDLIAYLNKEYYYECDKIVFYNNTFDEASNKKYFYALVIGADRSLIEITNEGNGNFKYSYIGNQLTTENVSETTGVSYIQIVNPDKYKKELELEKFREEAKNSPPDDTEMP